MNSIISVVIPVYNEQDAISQVVADIRKELEKTGREFEIIAVDDGSDDHTPAVLEQLDIQVIRHRKRQGTGAARTTGVLNAKGDCIVMTDGDGSYPTDVIPEMLDQLEHYDMVVGARKYEQGTWKVLRVPLKFVIRKIASFLVNYPIPDLNSGLRVFKREAVVSFLYLLPKTHSWVSTITLAFLSNNLTVHYIEIDYFKRIGVSKFNVFKDTYYYLLMVIRTTLLFNPLKVFIPLSLLFLGLFIVSSIRNLVISNSLQQIDIILFFFAMIVGLLGLVSDLIVTLFKNISRTHS